MRSPWATPAARRARNGAASHAGANGGPPGHAGAAARPGRAGQGGLRLAFSERLADPQQGVPGLRTWWQRYPYSCLEQTTSRAVGLNDADLWGSIMGRLPTYLDDDGLAMSSRRRGAAQPGQPRQ